jgi:hypothetical protein
MQIIPDKCEKLFSENSVELQRSKIVESTLNVGDLVRKDLIRVFFFNIIDEDIDILFRR